jgi:Signal transduction histidine kinase
MNQTIKEKGNVDTFNDYVVDKARYLDYVLDLQLQKKENPQANYLQYINVENLEADNAENYEEPHNEFTSYFYDHQEMLKYETAIFYYAYDNESRQSISNTKDHLDWLKNNKELQKKYQWYYQVHYDKNGNYEINFSSNDKDELLSYVKRYQLEEEYVYNENGNPLQKITYDHPKNITITYAIPHDLPIESDLSLQLTSPLSSNRIYTLPYIWGLSLIVLIMMIIIPYQYSCETFVLKWLHKVKIEIIAPIWLFFMFFLSYFSYTLIMASLNGYIAFELERLGIENFSTVIIFLLNMIYWFIYFGLLAMLGYMIKCLFHKGLKQFIMENTFIAWIIQKCYTLFQKVIQFDLNDDINKATLKIVAVNFIIISIISLFFVFGVFFSFVYSVIIFILLRKTFTGIKEDYQILLNATKQLSQGNFDVPLNNDIGLFNPLREEFSHIKDGFEKAVQEEVKSQKMKTELISNVSHDLKTPLTSIITYIDLLKSDQLDEQQRQEYLNVLDKNSIRLKNLIEDLFEVSKVNSGDVQLHIVDIDIVALIKQAQLECLDKFEEKNLDVRFQSNCEKIIYPLDSAKTYRIFENLFINISKYALSHTRVYLDVIENEDDIHIIFKNISESEMNFNENEIVERFVRGDKSRNTNGSGLGLAIVKSFVELQGGLFKVDIDGDLFKTMIIFKKKNA